MAKQIILLLLVVCFVLTLAACGGNRYKVDYDGGKHHFLGAKDSYRAGERVTLYFPMVATDTDYSFHLEGGELDVSWTDLLGYRLRFTMPNHDVKLTCETRNSMEYIPE